MDPPKPSPTNPHCGVFAKRNFSRFKGNQMANDVDPVKLQKITADMIAAITSPAYVQAMKTMKSTPLDKRLSVASQILTPAALKASGVPLPEGMRISSRYFEPGNPAVITADDHGSIIGSRNINETAGAWGCACGGAATACAGAGGGGS